MVGSLAELRKEGWVPFTHAPLYVHGNIDFDIIGRFHAESGFDFFVSHYDFDSLRIISVPKPHNGPMESRLFVMDDLAYPHFCAWLATVEIVNPNQRTFAVPRRVAAAIADPFMQFTRTTVPTAEVIDVWTVSTMQHFFKPKTHVETQPFPVFEEGEAEELTRDEFLKRLPSPASAPSMIKLEAAPPEPTVIARGKERLAAL
jgi:hypothetical protein